MSLLDDDLSEARSARAAAPPPPPALTSFTLIRADDLLEVQVQLQGFTVVDTPSGPAIKTTTGGVLSLRLPPQHLLEGLSSQPSKVVLSDASVLRFRVAANAAPIPLSIEGILAAVADLDLVVDPALPGAPPINDSGGETADVPKTPLPPFGSPFGTAVTQLFLPGRIGLTPRGGAMRLRHAARAVTHAGLVELWHSRLARRTTSGRHVERSEDIVGTAVALTRANVTNPTTEWNQAINRVSRVADDRAELIVKQSREQPGSLRSRQLMLSPLGAWVDLRGRWPGAQVVPAWRHEMAQGRDQSSRISIAGHMYPLGHAAQLDVITERELPGRNGRRARLRTIKQITITDEVMPYTGSNPASRQLPFGEIEILSVAPPEGQTKVIVSDPGTGPQPAAEVLLRGANNRPFAFRCRAIDKGGRSVHFRMPLVFVPNDFTSLSALATKYRQLVDAADSRYAVSLDGQRVTIATPAPQDDAAGSDVVLDVAKLAHASDDGEAGFRPVVREMSGWVPGIEDFGREARALTMRYASQFTANGFAAGNLGEVLLAIDAAPALSLMDAKAVGGMLSALELAPSGYSRKLGPVAGPLAQVALAKFEPSQLLGKALENTKLLGVFPLEPLLSTVNDLAHAPKVIAQTIDGARRQRFTWSAPLFAGNTKSIDVLLGRLRAVPNLQALLTVEGVAVLDPKTNMLDATVRCAITNVEAAMRLGSVEMVVVPLDAIRFEAGSGRSPQVKVQLGTIRFGGALRYLRTLVNLVDRTGFLNGNGIEILPDGVRTSFSLPVPSFAMGLFVLENISLGARFELPFNGRVPELALNFSTYDNPFRLTVLAIGGGGYVQVGVDLHGKLSLAAALEFGAAVSFNLVIAKASASVMGGIHFVLEDDEWRITGYLRLSGRLEVLGIASVSLEQYVGLSYDSGRNVVIAEAELIARVRLLFLKKTYRVPFRKEFAGPSDNEGARALPGAAAGFAAAMDPPGVEGARPWDDFCMAYAA